MFSESPIRVRQLGKCFHIYDSPRQRLLQMLFRGRRQYYREFWALRDVSFDVRRGETVGIIGRNGSGKSTLLQLLCGTLTPTEGSVDISGRVAALLELGAGFNPEFSGRENVFINAALLGMKREEIAARFREIEEFAEIGQFIDQPVKTYSSGMYVRLAFAVAVHTDPQILIVDEALAVGDARFQSKCLRRIKEMKARGVSILFVSHDISAVRTLCDRAVWLDSGSLRQQGPVFPVTAEYTEQVYSEGSASQGGESEPTGSELNSGALESEKRHPINHWGTHPGAIMSTSLCDEDGVPRSVFIDRQRMRLNIRVRPPAGADLDTLAVSCSIKDLAGTDLMVFSTWDDKSTRFSAGSEVFNVGFCFDNCLNSGEYLLAVSVEDRSSSAIQYYEYVEGSNYFSTVFHGNLHGRFIPLSIQSIEAA